MTRLLAFALLLTLALAPAAAQAGPVFTLTTSSPSSPANGIQFSPLGGEFTVTNTLDGSTAYPGSPLYLDYTIGYDRTDALGNVFFRQSGTAFQAYILNQMLSPTGAVLPPSTVMANAVFVGESEAVNLGHGLYCYTANLIGDDIPGAAGPIDVPAVLTITFDTAAPLGHQVIDGSLAFGDAPSGLRAAPEPASMAMVAIGLAFTSLATAIGLGGSSLSGWAARRRSR